MEMFSYVMVLASVIIGLGITHLLTGVADIVQHPGRAKVYWVHLLWVAATSPRAICWLLIYPLTNFETVQQGAIATVNQ